MSIFDPTSFLETVYKQAIDTKFHSVPEGEYIAQCKDINYREVTSDKIDGVRYLAELTWEITDEAVAASMNVERVPQVRQSVWLDLVTKNGQTLPQLDWGTNKNMGLKRLMDTFSLNDGKFAVGKLKFQTGYIRVSHRVNPEDPESPFAEVSRVTSLDKARAAQAAAA
jgi:hypothetical protein